MTPLQHVSLAVLYLAATILGGHLLRSVPGVSVGEAYLLAVATLAGGVALHYSLMRRLAGVVAQEPVFVVGGMTAGDSAAPPAHPRSGREMDRVVAEVKVLQSLVEQLYVSRSGESPVRTAAPAQAELAEASQPAAAGNTMPPVTHAQPVAGEVGVRRSPDPSGGVRLSPEPLPVAPGSADLEQLRASLRNGQVELALQPIVSLPQRKRRFYESFSRIRVGDGLYLMPQQYIAIAEQAGLITAIDNTLLFRCIQLLRRTRQRNFDIGFFCNISQYTLADRAFFHEFVRYMRTSPELAPSIVFEFPQRAIRGMDRKLERDLEELRRIGFRFSLDQVIDVDLDIDGLFAHGFRFVKIEAARLLAREDGLDPALLKRRLDARGIDLVVEKIESEAVLVELLDLDIDFGQGYLFGEPRLSRAGP